MKYQDLYELLKKYYETGEFDFNILKNYSNDAISKLNSMPFKYLKDKYSLDLLSRFLDPYFLESNYFYQDLSSIILCADNQELNYFWPLMLSEKAILENKHDIPSKDHIYDSMIMEKCNDKNIARHIYTVGVNGPSLESSFHQEDMEIIASYEDPHLAEMATLILCNEHSLQSPYHQIDFKIYKQHETDFAKAYDLTRIITDKDSLNSFYHSIDLNILAKNDVAEIGNILTSVATLPESLNSPNHLNHMQKIMHCKTRKEAMDTYNSLFEKPKVLTKSR